jgi:hypothetical protein
MSDAAVPEWLSTEVDYWIDLFNLEGWHIDIVIDRVVNDHPNCMGWCERNASYNHATLHFRIDAEDTPEWRKVVLHECLHIAMARVDAFVQDAMMPELDLAAQQIAGVAYTQHVESFVQTMTDACWRFYRGVAELTA